MLGRALAAAGVLLLSTQVYAQTNQGGTGPAQGVTSGPAAGSPAGMRSPQAGPVATKHQRKVLRHPGSAAGTATGSSSPTNTSQQR
jgi:hypothetical protein